ncbi:MAG: FkbM family methyltransferase [Candidatus Korobacteraceae bacterium]
MPASRSFRCFLGRHLIPQRIVWVQVHDGWAKGLWLQIDLSNERGWWLGKHEPAIQEALQQALGPNKVMYDVGAHIGFHALPAARLGAQVVAFEPDPESAARLRAHVYRNGLEHSVRIIEAAVWSSAGASIPFRRGLPRSQGGVCWKDRRPVLATGEIMEVAVIRLDDFVAGGGPTPHIIKIDVEGAESEVLKGAAGILRVQRPALIVEVHTANENAAVNKILDDAGYSACWNIPAEGFPRQCFAAPCGSRGS